MMEMMEMMTMRPSKRLLRDEKKDLQHPVKG